MHKPLLIPLVRTRQSRERIRKVLSVSHIRERKRERERTSTARPIAALGRQGLISFSVSQVLRSPFPPSLSPPPPLPSRSQNERRDAAGPARHDTARRSLFLESAICKRVLFMALQTL